jgi:predicted SAM-dependent methyltransferase
MNKLHLGCGKVYLHGWTNVDIFSTVAADMYCDITRLPYRSESFDIIYASHVLEHVHRHMVLATLQHWRDMLAPGGVLRLAVPNFSACCDYYKETGKLNDIMGLLYGGQNYSKNSHTVIFDEDSLRILLTKAGFSKTRKWDWRTTEHAQFDDYSQAFLPHMDRDNGMLMSLNMEAVR